MSKAPLAITLVLVVLLCSIFISNLISTPQTTTKVIYVSTVNGTSMSPTFKDGDNVYWENVDSFSALEVGHIIIYRHPTIPEQSLIVHRIVEIENVNGVYRFRTKGDGLSEPDQYWVDENHIVGVVTDNEGNVKIIEVGWYLA